MLTQTTFAGFTAWELRDDTVRLLMLPEWGGKIAVLEDQKRGRDWLYHNPHLPYTSPQYGASYVRQFDLGGFDECFPTVAPCLYPLSPWEQTPLPDHGEVWSLSWQTAPLENGLQLTVTGVALPYQLTKQVRLLGRGRVHLNYHLTNLSHHEIAFLWSSHPLLAISPGMELDIPIDRLWQNGQPEPLTWPWVQGLDCRRIPDPSVGRAMKLFATLTGGRVTLTDPTSGARLTFSFDIDQITHLGLWLNYGGWAGVPDVPPYFNLGLEPCIGGADNLADAVHHNLGAGRLRPHASQNWSLQLQVE